MNTYAPEHISLRIGIFFFIQGALTISALEKEH